MGWCERQRGWCKRQERRSREEEDDAKGKEDGAKGKRGDQEKKRMVRKAKRMVQKTRRMVQKAREKIKRRRGCATPAASLTKAETTHNYGFSASLTTSSPTFPSSMEASYGQIVDPQRLVADPNHFPLSGCTEMLEFARSANNYSGSSSQEVSSLSGSSSAVVDNNYVSNWSGNVGGDQDGFLMDFSFGHPYDLLNGFGFHERTSEVAPNFSPNLANSPYTNLLANCSDTKPQGIHQSITN
ncbi:hypothetical protein HHK36_021715 [Tetracentron sinense]|uniref:Uncharacterized protein n=1 Tax=Tetracentron sinense TaxID=13715 RepID=A0A834YXJ5_TETSI|nr:hypothetical protein HHK36_021715 [Tetracentron sinense]